MRIPTIRLHDSRFHLSQRAHDRRGYVDVCRELLCSNLACACGSDLHLQLLVIGSVNHESGKSEPNRSKDGFELKATRIADAVGRYESKDRSKRRHKKGREVRWTQDSLQLWQVSMQFLRAPLVQMRKTAVHLSGYGSGHRVTGSANFSSSVADALSTSAWRLLPRASIVTIAGKSFTRMCHIASGTPNSRKSTPSTL